MYLITQYILEKVNPMKKFVAFVMILSLGLFCAVGCNKPAAKPKDKAPVEKAADKAPADAAAPAEKPADAAAPAEKPADK